MITNYRETAHGDEKYDRASSAMKKEMAEPGHKA
jgi:hypothetical protein